MLCELLLSNLLCFFKSSRLLILFGLFGFIIFKNG
jgi:hypothetical protein